MPLWKVLLLGLYYQATLPLRWSSALRESARGRVPLVVLCYHRIADSVATPWTIPNRLFVRQIRWLQRHFEMISLEETQRRIRSGVNRRPAVSITFDDGYSENCREALPFLVRERIPCTCCVTAGNVLAGVPFEHDLRRGWSFAPHTPQELRAMAAAGIEIGAHTNRHVDLGPVTDPAQLQAEIVDAREKLRAAVGCPIRYFAFPFGQQANLSRRALDLAVTAGYEAACSAYGGFNLPGENGFHLERIAVDTSMLRLKNWVTGDPRKRRMPRFAWEPPRAGANKTQEDEHVLSTPAACAAG
jgi:peptidoglycan/xylan/chitin deacetylase (PgdA/CDA1 family)